MEADLIINYGLKGESPVRFTYREHDPEAGAWDNCRLIIPDEMDPEITQDTIFVMLGGQKTDLFQALSCIKGRATLVWTENGQEQRLILEEGIRPVFSIKK